MRRAFRALGSDKRRLSPRPASVTIEDLERRLVLTSECDCTANLFAGPRLVSVDTSDAELFDGVFNALLPGSYVDLTVTDWNAIATGDVEVIQDHDGNGDSFLPALQTILGVSSPEAALTAEATLGQIFQAAADAVAADGPTAELHAALLALVADVNVIALSGTVQLGSLLQATFPDGSFADVELNALNLVTGAIELYNYENVTTTNDPVTLSGTVFNDPGVNTVELWAQVIEPPIIDTAVCVGDQFYSAAVRIKMNVDLVDITQTVGLDQTLTIGEMQLYLDVARAQGTVTSIFDVIADAVTVQAIPGVADVYLGSISDSLFFNRTHLVTPADLDYGTIGTLTVGSVLPTILSVEAKGFSEGVAGTGTELTFYEPFPAPTQTATTSATFIAEAVDDILTSLDVQLTLLGVPVTDPTSGIRNDVANIIDEPLTALLANVGDPLLDQLGTGVGEMDVSILAANCIPDAIDDAYTTAEDVPLIVAAPGVLSNDLDGDGDGLTVTSTTDPPNGSVTLNPDGSFTYTPDANFNGLDTFNYSN